MSQHQLNLQGDVTTNRDRSNQQHVASMQRHVSRARKQQSHQPTPTGRVTRPKQDPLHRLNEDTQGIAAHAKRKCCAETSRPRFEHSSAKWLLKDMQQHMEAHDHSLLRSHASTIPWLTDHAKVACHRCSKFESYIHIYIYIYIFVYTYIYLYHSNIYIYIERERLL